jgi:hypothetical protein
MRTPIPHPQGEPETTAWVAHAGPVAVDTFGGRVHVEWDAEAAVTPLGQRNRQLSGVIAPPAPIG